MTRRDHAVVGTLLLLFALIVGAVAAPAFTVVPIASPSPSPSAPVARQPRPYREGVVGRTVSVNPLTATTRADHELVSLVFGGLVALGPGNSLVPGLASSWTVDPSGKAWTFRIRDDAKWQDGAPVTADDVVFTVDVIKDPRYGGPSAASWRDVTARADGERVVTFELSTPIGGFLQAATQPIVPAHLLRGVPIAQLADHPFGQKPVGSGPFTLVSLDEHHAVLEPSTFQGTPSPGVGPGSGPGSAPPTAAPSTVESTRPRPRLPGIELQFFEDPAALMAAWEAGSLDGASGLPAADASRLAAEPGNRLLRYPSSTLTAVVLNLRKTRPEFRDPRVRVALLKAIDRDRIVTDAYAGGAVRADAPLPPSSWAFSSTASKALTFDAEAARKDLLAAGWKAIGRKLARPGGKAPLAFDLLSPDKETNPSNYATAASIASDWQALGLDVTHMALPATDLVAKRLRPGSFSAAVVDVNIGLDPDLYPLLASTQTTSLGLNLSGVQDRALDKLLIAARAPGTDQVRTAAYAALQAFLDQRQYVLPIAFRDELFVARGTLDGPAVRQVADPGDRFWDVLTWRLADGR
jgi:peptide/nickel transport system substrate-binding protein